MPKREWNDVPDDAFKMSQSTINSLELSPCRVTTLPEGVKLPPSNAMFRGTVTHAVLEQVENGEVTAKKAILTSFVHEIAEEEAHAEGIEQILDMEDFSQIAMLVKAWLISDIRDSIRAEGWVTVEAEKPRSRKVCTLPNGQDFYLVTGGIDRIYATDRGYVGIDWKTAGRGWSKGDGTGVIQDDIYAWLAEPDYGFIEEWQFVVGRFDKMQWDTHVTWVTPESIDAALTRAIGWAEFLTADHVPHLCTPLSFKKRGWWAKPAYNHGYCHTCRHLADEWDNDPAWEQLTQAQSSGFGTHSGLGGS